MELPGVFSRYRTHINAGLRAALDRDGLPLFDMLRYHMGWLDEDFQPVSANAGKAVRPALCLFACEAVGGDWRQALPAAASIELIHNFSLVHDDIQDGDIERRHRPTIWYRWGHSHGLNAGSAMNVLANLAMLAPSEVPLDRDATLQASRILTEACLRMIEGQALDLSYEQRATVTVDDYLIMIEKKTGALLEASLHIGAMIGTRSEASIESVRRFGAGIGRLFQVQDDILGVWGRTEATGKPIANDLRRRKKSLPVVHALEHAGEKPGTERFATIYRSKEPLSEEDLAELLAILEVSGSYQFCRGMAQREASHALEALEAVEMSAEARKENADLVQFLLERDY